MAYCVCRQGEREGPKRELHERSRRSAGGVQKRTWFETLVRWLGQGSALRIDTLFHKCISAKSHLAFAGRGCPDRPHAQRLSTAPQGAEEVSRIGLIPTGTVPLGMALLLPARSW